MNKLSIIICFLFASCAAFAQFTIDLTVDEVSVSGFCDADGFPSGDSDARWVLSVSDNRGSANDDDFNHEVGGNNGPDIFVSSGFDNPLDFSGSYDSDICPPNFLTLDFRACDSDVVGTCTGGDLQGDLNTILLIPTMAGVTNPSFSFTAPNCGGSGLVTYTFDMTLTITGSASYICADNPCTAEVQPIQNACGGNTLDTTRYDVSTSNPTLSATFFDGDCPAGNGGGNNDIFFQFVAPTSGEILIDMSAYEDFGAATLTDITLNLLEGSCSSLVKVDTETYTSTNETAASAACIDLSGGILNTSNYSPYILQGLTGGQTYFLRASEDEDQEAYADLSFQAIVENDACANATALIGPGPIAGCNFNGTDRDEPDEIEWTGAIHTGTFGGGTIQACPGWSSNENMVWYTFEVDADTPQPITITVGNVVCTSGGDLQMGVWYQGPATACDIPSYIGVGCDTGLDALSVMLPPAVPNGTYYVGIDGNAGSQCTFEIDSDQVLGAPSCVADAYYSGSIAAGTYQTSATIGSKGTVAATDSVNFFSNCIMLDPDFEVVLGGVFCADIDPCVPRIGNSSKPASSMDSNTATAIFDVNRDEIVFVYQLQEAGKTSLKLRSAENAFEMLVLNNFEHLEGKHQLEIAKIPDGVYSLDLLTPSGKTVTTEVVVKRP